MKAQRKLLPVYVTRSPAIYSAVSNIAEARAQMSEACATERVRANLQRIQDGAAAILKRKRFENPLAVFTIGELDRQAEFARAAFVHVKIALQRVAEGDLLGALDSTLIAADDFENACAEPPQKLSQGLRKRTAETVRRADAFNRAASVFEKEFNFRPAMGRERDRQWMNEKLGRDGFRTYGAFRKWKWKLKPETLR